jgi:hypothetical protein
VQLEHSNHAAAEGHAAKSEGKARRTQAKQAE